MTKWSLSEGLTLHILLPSEVQLPRNVNGSQKKLWGVKFKKKKKEGFILGLTALLPLHCGCFLHMVNPYCVKCDTFHTRDFPLWSFSCIAQVLCGLWPLPQKEGKDFICMVGRCGPERVVRWPYGERGHMVMQGGAEPMDTFLTHSNILCIRRRMKWNAQFLSTKQAIYYLFITFDG
jgi:hypothetical protein